jgi:DNA ligase-1
MPDLADGESIEMQGSGAKPYVLKNVGGVYSCSCPAWRNQSQAIERRTCKHLRKLRGDSAEQERCGGELPARAAKRSSDKSGPSILLAQSWDSATDLKDWWMSEKLDGVRAYWDGSQFLSRQGNTFHAPEWFVKDLPSTPLDGELWIDRKAFQRTVSVVRRQDKSEHWKEVRFLVFDAPQQHGGFEERIEFLDDFFRSTPCDHAEMHAHQICKGTAHLKRELSRVEKLGGEGLMLRQPNSQYEIGRSFTLLKVKSFQDAEATVVDHAPGKGKHKGRLGALVVQLDDGTQFSVGTGFSDKQRESPPAIGSAITFRYQELSDGGVPRFPSFVRASTHATASGGSAKKAVEAAKAKLKTAQPKTAVKSAKRAKAKSAAAAKRYFEFSDAKSQKFWEIETDGTEVTVRYGRLGATGTTQTKTFADDAAAKAHADKLIAEKTRKGYQEQ